MPDARALLASALIACLPAAVMVQDPLAVQIVIATHSTDTRTLSLTGEIVARDTLSASFLTAGRISAMLVLRGDRIAAGAPLARIDSVQQEQALRSAEAGLASAQATSRQAQDDANRQDGLLERGATTRSARDAAADQLRAAQAGVAQAQADRDRAQKALDDTVLTAPADATVTNRMAEVGQVVGAAQPVLDLALGDRYDAIFMVPEVVLTVIPAKTPTVQLSPVGHPDVTFQGTIREISPLVDPTEGTVKVTVGIRSLPSGITFGDAVIGTVVRSESHLISLPWTAMSVTAQGPAVWVVNPSTHQVELRQVKILRFETGRIVLESGVKEGEQVVGLGSHLLFPGRPVVAAEVK